MALECWAWLTKLIAVAMAAFGLPRAMECSAGVNDEGKEGEQVGGGCGCGWGEGEGEGGFVVGLVVLRFLFFGCSTAFLLLNADEEGDDFCLTVGVVKGATAGSFCLPLQLL